MWETAEKIFFNVHPWSTFAYFVAGLLVGAIVGAWLSIYWTHRTQRPDLRVSGNGSGGDTNGYRWTITIMNRQTFLFRPIEGESAKDLGASLRKDDRHSYPLYWHPDKQPRVTLDSGASQSLTMFRWTPGQKGYFIEDEAGDAVALFSDPTTRFVLRLYDRLARATEIKVTVLYDDSHLKQAPQLRIVGPTMREVRWMHVRRGFRSFWIALTG